MNVVPTAQLPADVRSAGAQAIKDYKAALGFEQLLAGQLVKEMSPQDGPLADGPYATQMQDAMAGAVAGGLGLARQLYKEMHP